MSEENAMRRLVLLRHGKSAYPDGVEDFDRPLGPRGIRDSPLAGQWLIDNDLWPDKVLISAANRTQKTAALALESGLDAGLDTDITIQHDLYGCGVHHLMEVVAAASAQVRTLLVVGHEPTMSGTVTALTGRHVSFPTATLAVMSLRTEWAKISGGCAELERMRTPRGGEQPTN